MVLNNKPQMFTIFFPSNFFYEEVKSKWSPIIEKMRLPYQGVDDFMNAQLQSVTFPTLSIETSTQTRGQYDVVYPGGKETENFISKDLNFTFKLTESYVSYFIWWDQIDLYLHYTNKDFFKEPGKAKKPCWMEPVHLAFLSDAGYKLTEFTFKELTPLSLSDLQLSYAATAAQYNTFNVLIKYNRFDVN